MRLRISSLLAAALSLQTTSCDYYGYNVPRDGHVYRITNLPPGEKLSIVNAPGNNGQAVGAVPDGAEVTISKCQVVAGYSSQWCLMSHAGATGWVNSYYLQRLK